jgi:F420-non-reducing hydrogenase iron-sulfur subunit
MVVTSDNYEPRIVGFLCNWCAYQGADLAGTSRMAYTPNVRIVRVMCTGRIDPTFVLKAFSSGADGVIIAGCHPGDCHYSEGNYKTTRRIAFLRKLLAQMGIDGERFRLEWVSAGEGAKWAQIADEMSAAIKEKGPLAWRENLKEA